MSKLRINDDEESTTKNKQESLSTPVAPCTDPEGAPFP